MTLFETLALVYFVVVAAIGARPPATGRQIVRGTVFAAGALALVIVARFALPWEARAWMPHAYLALGYWSPAAFTPAVNVRFERWLARADARLGADRWTASTGVLEVAYLLCFPFVPAAFAVVFFLGDPSDVVRFWVAVLTAGFGCYGTLRWTAARPPRLASGAGGRRGMARLNALLLGRVSHNLNTFPSGHVAVSLAAALAVAHVHPSAGALFVAAAAAIALAAVAGRYHYLIDVIAGLVAGVLASLTRFL